MSLRSSQVSPCSTSWILNVWFIGQHQYYHHCLLEMQNLGPHSGCTEPEPVF